MDEEINNVESLIKRIIFIATTVALLVILAVFIFSLKNRGIIFS